MKAQKPDVTEPTHPSGPFARIHSEIRLCKLNATCPNLNSRSYYFEPNPDTAARWADEGRFTKGIDRRVMFVCESPGPQGIDAGVNTQRCWALTTQDARFKDVREKYGLQDCYITNIVKCGVRPNS